MRTVIFVAPFPLDTTMRFVRAASALPGVRLLGVMQELPRPEQRHYFSDIAVVRDGLSLSELFEAVELLRRKHGQPARIIGVLEPIQEMIAAVRERFGIPGTDLATAQRFRDKAKMKDHLRAAGIPVARHRLLTNLDDAMSFAGEVGFPMVLKPPAGMGAKATFRVRGREELVAALRGLGAGPQRPVLAEEFLQGEEGSCDTLLLGGVPKMVSVSWYQPSCLTALENPWIQWCCVLPRENQGQGFDDIKALAVQTSRALGLESGFTHMEWFRRADGSLAVGEIAQRPPGAHITRMIGLAYDMDPYRMWVRTVVDERFDGPWERRYAVGCAFLRGIGRGRVASVTGVAEANAAVGAAVVEARMPTPGMPKSDAYEGDGYAIVRDPRTSVVQAALGTIIGKVRVRYA
ncbi:ATP-grasp domain-containing protein [Pseudenhygromyxa sp. WMMC2535]|uniref:ATP-grasp domain-containing protein n=1 Tax=Pseudenhygromyxa sp. WMMC2535 TaxID=2712867 RepID=UPI0015529102|nr:ATP-grasp domain-containing protein [Pseudenhygromyxa sp. WMMC2535]NVB42520.1 ATP-grasp domain-containing protein [Pseudenhygromyxa sp. WMMC2535]